MVRDHDLFAFQAYRTHRGELVQALVYRRNGRVAMACRCEEDTRTEHPGSFRFHRSLLTNLTRVERRTWRRLLDGRDPG